MAYVCSHCLHDQFQIITKRNGIVKITTNEEGQDVPELISEEEVIIGTDFVACNNCHHPIAPDGSDLVLASVCSNCNGYALPDTLDENGHCSSCQVPVELKGLTENEYIKKILELQKQLYSFNNKKDSISLEDIPDIEV